MSIAVSIDELPAAIHQQIGWCYLLTVADGDRARVVAIAPAWDAGALVADVGARTAANVAARPDVTLVYPAADAAGYSLIVDGHATVDGDATVRVVPTSAVMHRPAPGQ